MDISVIIPVFKGENSLQRLFEGIQENLKSGKSFEVIFIYDNGPDNSWEVLKLLKNKHPLEIKIYRLKRNYGQHSALLFGMTVSNGDLLVTMDEDLQHDPNYLIPMIEKQKEGNFDVIYGRFSDPKHPLLRNLASKILQKSLKLFISGIDYYSSYRIIKKEIAEKITLQKSSYAFIDAVLIKITSDIGFLDIDHSENTRRKTSYNFSKLVSHAVNIFLAYTNVTRWFLRVSILLILFGGTLLIFDLANKRIQEWSLVIGLITLIVGILSDQYLRWKMRNNLLPVLSDEYE